MKQGEKIIVEYVQLAYNTNRKITEETQGIFIKDYGNYIQFLDKYKIRRSIMKNDLIKIQHSK